MQINTWANAQNNHTNGIFLRKCKQVHVGGDAHIAPQRPTHTNNMFSAGASPCSTAYGFAKL